MLDLVPVQLKIEGRSPGELFRDQVRTVYTQLNALVIHLSQVIPNVIEPEDIRKRSLHQQIGGGHVIEFQCSVYDIKHGKVKPNVVGCLSLPLQAGIGHFIYIKLVHLVNGTIGGDMQVWSGGQVRSEERRVGKGCVSTCRSR